MKPDQEIEILEKLNYEENKYTQVFRLIETKWIKVITKVSNKGIIKVINKLHIEVTPSTINHNPLFNQQISEEISNGTAIGMSDALLKNNKIGEY